MAYWREYRNKYGALINHALIYTAKDRAIQAQRKLNKANPTQRRMYYRRDKDSSIRYFIRTGDPQNYMLDCLQDRMMELECKRTQLALTRAILHNKRAWGDTMLTPHGIVVGIHLSGNLDVIKQAIYQLEYDVKYLQWVVKSYDRSLIA